ncbi:MAG: transcription termination/antitermination factor NusG [Pirellulales bacterium]|nr:transcription termination/antitermination factor NusG [Pirellulales bacterium]
MTDETFKPTDEPAVPDCPPTDEARREGIDSPLQDTGEQGAGETVAPRPADEDVAAGSPEPQGELEPAVEPVPAESPEPLLGEGGSSEAESPGEAEAVTDEALPGVAPAEELVASAEEPETPAEAEPDAEPAPAEGLAALKKEKPAGRRARAKKEGGEEEKEEKKGKEEKKEDVVEEPKSENMQWYILKVQSNREESIREGLQRRVAIAGLGRFFGDVIVPIEKVTEVKGGKRRVLKRKLYPGYLVVQMEINEDTWFLVRETPGIGDFTGAAGHPTPMLPHEVSRIVLTQEEKTSSAPRLQIAFSQGDRVKINEGTFENFEGEVESIDAASGRVIVMINIFGRSTPVELEYWQIEAL